MVKCYVRDDIFLKPPKHRGHCYRENKSRKLKNEQKNAKIRGKAALYHQHHIEENRSKKRDKDRPHSKKKKRTREHNKEQARNCTTSLQPQSSTHKIEAFLRQCLLLHLLAEPQARYRPKLLAQSRSGELNLQVATGRLQPSITK